jgi:hypothetical protein
MGVRNLLISPIGQKRPSFQNIFLTCLGVHHPESKHHDCNILLSEPFRVGENVLLTTILHPEQICMTLEQKMCVTSGRNSNPSRMIREEFSLRKHWPIAKEARDGDVVHSL